MSNEIQNKDKSYLCGFVELYLWFQFIHISSGIIYSKWTYPTWQTSYAPFDKLNNKTINRVLDHFII